MKMDKVDLLKLKKNLPKGFRQVLSKEYDVSLQYIDMIFKGVRDNLSIVESALLLAQGHKDKKNSLSKSINKL
jgi:hypothetical protein